MVCVGRTGSGCSLGLLALGRCRGGSGCACGGGEGLGDGTGRGVLLCPAGLKCSTVPNVAGTSQHLFTLQLFSCSKVGAIDRSREEGEGGAAVEDVSRQLELGKKLEPMASAFLGKQGLLSLGFRKVLRVCRKGNLVRPLSLCSCTAEQLCWVAFVELSVTLPAAGGGRTPRQQLCCEPWSQSRLTAQVLGCTLVLSHLSWHRCVVAPPWPVRTCPQLCWR